MTEDVAEELLSRRLDPYRDPEIPKEDDLQAEKRRQRVVSRLRVVAAGSSRRRQYRTLGFTGATALAAAAVLALGLNTEDALVQEQQPESTSLTLSVEGREAEVASSTGVVKVPAGQPAQLEEIQRISTRSDSRARVEVGGRSPDAGVDIEVGPGSELAFAQVLEGRGIERVNLSQGSVQVEVRGLKAGDTFMVITSSVRAVVVGTAFTVAVNPNEEHDTCVRVSEGTVRLEGVQAPHTELASVSAGESWGCEKEASKAKAEDAPSAVNVPVTQVRKRKAKTAQTPTPTSTLAQESAIFARAVRHNQEENYLAAERDLDELLRKYPKSALASEALRLRSKMREAAQNKARGNTP